MSSFLGIPNFKSYFSDSTFSSLNLLLFITFVRLARQSDVILCESFLPHLSIRRYLELRLLSDFAAFREFLQISRLVNQSMNELKHDTTQQTFFDQMKTIQCIKERDLRLRNRLAKSLTQQESVSLHHNVFECFYDVMKEKINIETSGGVHGQIQRYIA